MKEEEEEEEEAICKHEEVKAYNKIIAVNIALSHAKALPIHGHKPYQPCDKTQPAYPHFLSLLS